MRIQQRIVRQAGVTLVEMMVAVAMMFLIAAIAIPAYRGYLETARQEVLVARVEAFRIFQENYRVDEGEYRAGTYISGVQNDFAVIGYQVPNDDDGLTMVVAACDGGTIAECYKVTATNSQGETAIWQDGAYTWP
jgi:Tfp pilus assembly protein PilE